MSVYVHIYMYMYMCTYICIYAYVYIYKYLCVCVHMYICMCVHICICICVSMYICIYVYTRVCRYVESLHPVIKPSSPFTEIQDCYSRSSIFTSKAGQLDHFMQVGCLLNCKGLNEGSPRVVHAKKA